MSGADKATGKTKEMVKMTKNLKLKTTLIVTDKKIEAMVRAVRNIPGISVLPVDQINAHDVLRHQSLVITKEAVESFTKPTLIKSGSKEQK